MRPAFLSGPRYGIVLVLPGLVACGDDGDPAGPEPLDPAVASVTVTASDSTLTWLGETAEFSATVRDSSDNVLSEESVTWSSADDEVASVDESGEVTAVSNGETVIEASVEGVSGEAPLTVEQVPTAVGIAPEEVTFDAAGDTVRLSAEAEDEGGSPVEELAVEWTSVDPDVAEVDEEGLVTAVEEGSTTVVAAVDEIEAQADVSVEQVMVSLDIQVERDSLHHLGDSVQAEATARDRLDNPIPGTTAEWASEDPEIATVDSTGWVTSLDNGTARIHAEVDDFEADTVLVVSQRAAALSVSVGPGDAAAGEPLGIPPEVELQDAGGHRVAIDSETEVSATLESGGGELHGTLTAQADEGVSVFDDLTLEGSAGEKTLAFGAPDLEPAVSEPFVLDPGAPTTLAQDGGGGQEGLADTELPDSLTVTVEDDWENGVPGVEVTWSGDPDGGDVSSNLTETDDSGRAAVAYTLGPHPGEEEVHAEAADLAGSPVEFLLTATPNATITGTVSLTSDNLMVASATHEGTDGLTGQSVTPDRTATHSVLQDAPPGGPRRPATPAGQRPVVLEGGSSEEGMGSSGGERIRGPEFVPGELIVTLRPEAVEVPSARAMTRAGMGEARRVADEIRSVLTPMGRMEEGGRAKDAFETAGVSPVTLSGRIRLEDANATDAVRQRLQADPRVERVERNRIIHRDRFVSAGSQAPGETGGSAPVPSATDTRSSGFPVSDPLYPYQAWHYAMIDLPEAWDITTGSSSVTVAVVDDGIRFDHPDIAENLTSDGYDFVSNDWEYDVCGGGTTGRSGDGDGYDPDPTIPIAATWDPLNECIDGQRASGGHGLHVAGTVGAVGNDDLGGTGVNWDVSIRPVRIFDILAVTTDYDVTQGILYAAGLPADDGDGGVVQASETADVVNMSFGGPEPSTNQETAIEAARDTGALLVAAAGNSATSDPMYPAAYPEVISVSAVDPYGDLTSYSSYGSTIELAAPGGESALGCDFAVTSTTWNFQDGQPNWDCWQGTSMAAPHVSGVAALILATEPGLSAGELRSRLTNWAVDLGDPDSYGYGLVNARNSLTRSFEPDGEVHVALLDAESGGEVDRAVAAADGTFEFRELDDAEYLVFAGRDRNGDGVVGVPRRRWGGFGGSMDPSAVEVDGADEYPASFTIGFPLESEPNDTFEEANRLVLGGYVQGTIDGTDDVDVFRVSIPEAGTYTFETSPLGGACGFALEENTVLQLHDGSGALLREEVAIDPDASNFCARITEFLDEPGDYFLAVHGLHGDRRYGLHAREGS